MNENELNSVISPCIKQCAINRKGYCTGCLRSLKEVANWAKMSAEERQRIMAELPQRAASGKFR